MATATARFSSTTGDGSTRAQFDGDATAITTRCTCDQRHFAFKHAHPHPPL
jgi:hypothetical protein